MSLVAYESSGEESEGEELEEVRDAGSQGPKLDPKDETKGSAPVEVLHKGKDIEVKAVDSSQTDISQLSQNEGNAEKPRKGIFSFLPPPKKRSVDFIIDEEDDIPFKKSKVRRVKENVESLDDVDKDASGSKTEIHNGTSAKLNLPKPKRVDDKQKLKIALPSLPDVSIPFSRGWQYFPFASFSMRCKPIITSHMACNNFIVNLYFIIQLCAISNVGMQN